jgi:hypothetical protein
LLIGNVEQGLKSTQLYCLPNIIRFIRGAQWGRC